MFDWLGIELCDFFYIYIGLSQSHVTDRELRGLIWVDHGVFFSVVFFN